MNRETIKQKPAIIARLIQNRESSDLYKRMVESDVYYQLGNTEIMSAQKNMVVTQTHREFDEGMEVHRYLTYSVKEDKSKANFKLPHGFHFELVNQCTNFLTGRPIRLSWQYNVPEDEDKLLIDNILRDKNSWGKFGQVMTRDAQRYSLAYARVSLDSKGDFRYDKVDPKSVTVFTNEYGDLEMVTVDRLMSEYDDDGNIVQVRYYDVYDDTYRDTYVLGTQWELHEGDIPLLSKNTVVKGEVIEGTPLSWGQPPFIMWKGSDENMTSLEPIKPFIDMMDITISNWANDIEDVQQLIWILKNYDGEDIDEFMSDLKEHKAINVGEDGDVRTERAELPYKARQELYHLLLKNIYRFGRGIDFTDRENLGNITGTGLKWSYELLEEKANEIEINGQEALDDLFRFIFKYLEVKGYNYFKDFDVNNLNFVFDRSLMINEKENIENAMKYSSFGSLKTALEHTDWVKDVDVELTNIQEEGEVSVTDMGQFERDEDEEETVEETETVDKPSR